MWRAHTELGFLKYSFIESVEASRPYYIVRLLGGMLYLSGFLIMVWNVRRTIVGERFTAPAPALAPAE